MYHALKEKNLFRIEGTNDYLDLNTGVFYENGTPAPYAPATFFNLECRSPLDHSIKEFALYHYSFDLKDCPDYLHQVERYAYAGKWLGLKNIVNLPYYIDLLASFHDLSILNRDCIEVDYLQCAYDEELLAELGACYKNITNSYCRYDVIIEDLVRNYGRRFEKPVLHSLLKFFVKQKLYLASPFLIGIAVNSWIKWKTKLNEPLTECPSHGLLIELADMQQRIKVNDRAEFDKLLNENNNKKWLYYKNDQFIASPLISCAAFHDEATQQDNCVQRMYLKNCAHGKTHIVAVRSISNPSQSLITCEIDPKNHEIKQWLRAHNAEDTNINSLRFREEYQNYLYKNKEEDGEGKTNYYCRRGH